MAGTGYSDLRPCVSHPQKQKRKLLIARCVCTLPVKSCHCVLQWNERDFAKIHVTLSLTLPAAFPCIHLKLLFLAIGYRASLVAQWLRIHLPIQGTQVRALIQEGPTCRRATKPVHHNYWSPRITTTEAHAPRACALQQEKPPQWEDCAPQGRVTPTCRN